MIPSINPPSVKVISGSITTGYVAILKNVSLGVTVILYVSLSITSILKSISFDSCLFASNI